MTALLFVAVLAWLLAGAVAGVWMIRAELIYFDLYRKLCDPNLPKEPGTAPPDEAVRNSLERVRILWKRQELPEVEAARQRVIDRWKRLWGVVVGGFVIVMVISFFGG